jgi:P27 family predicted phage terminase small subunit
MTQPIPDNVRKLRGNAGKRKPPRRPKPVVATPSKPSDLKGEALAEWKRITPELERMGLLSKLDRGILLLYCASYGIWSDAWAQIREDGSVTVDERKLPRKHPLWQVFRDSAGIMAGAAKDLGLTPAARGRMTVPEKEEDGGDGILD